MISRWRKEDSGEPGLTYRTRSHRPPASAALAKPILTLLTACGLCLTLTSCHPRQQQPSITFTQVPVASEGGPDTLGTFSGRVTGSKPGQHIVLYAKSNTWYVQPNTRQPYTAIQPDGSWSSAIHLGGQYAALLVAPGFQPNPILMALPAVGKDVVVIATVNGSPGGNGWSPPSAPKPIYFSGYDWSARTARSNRGGILRPYSPDNAWVDSSGSMHLKVTRQADRWTCAEVSMVRSLGYGTYNFEVRDVGHFDPAALLNLFTWTDDDPDEAHHEMDFNVGRRGDPASKNAEYDVQPYYVPSNVFRFNVPPGRLTFSMDWEPGSISFQTWKGSVDATQGKRISDHTFVSGVPPAGGETPHMNPCVFGYGKVTLQHEAEVVIDRFQYLP